MENIYFRFFGTNIVTNNEIHTWIKLGSLPKQKVMNSIGQGHWDQQPKRKHIGVG
jgi:hypothetical protein